MTIPPLMLIVSMASAVAFHAAALALLVLIVWWMAGAGARLWRRTRELGRNL